MSPQPLGTFELAVLPWVEPVLRLTSTAEGLPPPSLPPLPGALWIGKPGQQVVHRIIDDQLVEVVAVKRTEPGLFQQIRDGLVNQLIERAMDRLQGGVIPSDPQVQSALLGLEKRGDRPVLAVVLGPENSAILQLSQGAQLGRASVGGAQRGAVDPRQVDDWNGIGRKRHFAPFARQHAAEPDRRTGARGRVVRSQSQEPGQREPKAGQQTPEFAFLVGPEDAGWGNGVVLVERGGRLKRVQQVIKNCRLAWHGYSGFRS